MKIVLGGGLGGLASAYYLLSKHPGGRVALYEASNRTGGWISSKKLEDDVIFERSARTLRPRGEAGHNTLNLIDELGISEKIVPITSSHPAARNRMIYANGKLHTLPSSLMKIFQTTSPFSKPLIMHILNDLKGVSRVAEDDDESIYSFVDRRFGREVAEYAISPLVCGICAGNAHEISVKFLMKSLFEKEQKYGGVIKGLIYDFLSGKTQKSGKNGALVELAKKDKWSVYSLEGGLEMLPRTLEKNIVKNGADLYLNKVCEKLEFFNGVGVLTVGGYPQEGTADHVVSSLSAHGLAELVRHQHPKLADLLEQIPLVDVAVVNLLYKSRVHSREAFGFLVPPSENLPILGVIFDSCCFPSRQNTVLTVMMGGHWFHQRFGASPREELLLHVALEQVRRILDIRVQPDEYKVNILRKCIPQYTVGHERRVADILKYISERKLPLSLCGSSYHGVGVNDVIYSARRVVDAL